MAKIIKIPWKAWYGDEYFMLSFPDEWNISFCAMKDASELTEHQIEEAFNKPIGSLKLRELARNRKNCAIVVDDISRPTKAEAIIKKILKELQIAGISKENVRIIFALGAHRPMYRDDMIKKVGLEIYNSVDVMNHYAYENLVDCGRSKIGTPIKINRYFMESDLKLSVSCIEPHEWAGFGGGAKNVCPGVSGIKTLEANHSMMSECYQGMTGVMDGNRLRADIEDIAGIIGLDAIVNIVTTSERGIAGVFVGDTIKAHRAGVEFARKVFATELIYDQDAVILNGYPKDTEITQITNAFNILSLSEKEIVKKDGIVIVTTACPEGRGFHSLLGHGTRLAPRKEDFGALFQGRTGIIFSPNLNKYDVYHYFPDNIFLFNQWDNVIRFITEKNKDISRIAVFPTTPLQMNKQ